VKKIILIFCIFITQTSVWAAWTIIATDIDSQDKYYIDRTSIRKDGNFRKAWLIKEEKKSTKSEVLSIRMRFEFDCKNERFRYLSFTHHSGPMAEGRILYSQSEASGWYDTPPDSIGNEISQDICKR